MGAGLGKREFRRAGLRMVLMLFAMCAALDGGALRSCLSPAGRCASSRTAAKVRATTCYSTPHPLAWSRSIPPCADHSTPLCASQRNVVARRN